MHLFCVWAWDFIIWYAIWYRESKIAPLKYVEKKLTLLFMLLKIILKNFRFSEMIKSIVKDFAFACL